MRAGRTLLAVCALALSPDGAATAGTLRSMDALDAAIRACWRPPIEAKGSSVILLLSFRRDGSLSGPPLMAGGSVPGGPAARRRLIASAAKALDRCTPFHLAPALASDIAGLAFTMQFFPPQGH